MAKKKKTEDWKQLLDMGRNLIDEGCDCIGKSVQFLMKEKGFKNWELFDASMTGDGETVITFDGCGEMGDLDIESAEAMTKKQIISQLIRYMRIQDNAFLERLEE